MFVEEKIELKVEAPDVLPQFDSSILIHRLFPEYFPAELPIWTQHFERGNLRLELQQLFEMTKKQVDAVTIKQPYENRAPAGREILNLIASLSLGATDLGSEDISSMYLSTLSNLL